MLTPAYCRTTPPNQQHVAGATIFKHLLEHTLLNLGSHWEQYARGHCVSSTNGAASRSRAGGDWVAVTTTTDAFL